MATRARKTTILLVCVLASGGGLLAAGVLALWRGADRAELRAEGEARRAAASWAKAAQLRLRAPEFRNAMPVAARFEVREGRLIASPEVLAARPLDLDDELALRRLAIESARLEQAMGDVEAADRLLRAILDDDERGERLRGAVAALRGHLLLRAARADEADEVLEHARDLGAPLDPTLISGLAAVGAALPDETPLVIARLPHPAGEALVERLARHDAATGEAVGVATRRARARLELEARVRRELPRLLATDDTAIDAVDGGVLVWHPGSPGQGSGVWARPDVLADVLRGDLDAEEAAIVAHGDGVLEDGFAVAPGLAALPRPRDARGEGRRDVLLLASLAALALVFALTLGLTLRAVRREALAARARADFLVSVTHELKTPLSSIRLLAEMLDDGRVASEEKRATYHALLSGEAARLSMLIENVLDIGRIERGERRLDAREEPIDPVLAEAAALFAPIAVREGIALDVDLRAPDAIGRIDRAALIQVALNLLDNARKHGGGTPVTLSSASEGGVWTGCVRDHGAGVAPAERETVFERFGRGAATREGAVPGVGLGLYLARAIVTELGGTLDVESPRDGGPGAAFVITLPEAPA